MKSLLRFGLTVGASLGVGVSAAHAQEGPAVDAVESVDTIVVIGQNTTYSATDTTEAMALQQSPVTSILSQVDNLPGVLVSEGDTFGFDDWSTGVAVRGFQNNLGEQQLGITVDGLPNGGSNYGGGAKANRYIDTQNAGGVEVAQGTADIATRSNEALGGTLNFTTRSPEDDRRVRVSGSVGDFDAQRVYLSYDSGYVLNDTTKYWVSLSSQSASDHITGTAQNRRDHFAAKAESFALGVDWTGYVSYDDTHEDNYQRLFSETDFDANPNDDQLTGEWTDVPYINQLYRQAWSTLRENFFAYVKGEKDFGNGFSFEGSVYRHDNDGRGDWVPPYIVEVTADGAGAGHSELVTGNTVYGGAFLGQIFFVNPDGSSATLDGACASSITFPYGGAGPQYDPACYARNAIPVQSYRHTHYQKERTGLTGDLTWEMDFGAVENVARAGVWYEDATRYEYRDWHKLNDARVGIQYVEPAYWVQYNRTFPQSTFKWYVEDVVSLGDFSARVGLKQFKNEIERTDRFNPANPALNFSVDFESDVLLSGGLAWTPSMVDGLEVFAGYAENFKAIPDSVLEVLGGSGVAGLPEPETAENIEAGVRYSGDRFSGSLVYFDSTFENRLFPAPNESVSGIDYLEASNGGFINGGGIDSSGFELAGEFTLNDSWSFYGSYTNIDASILGTDDAALDLAAGIFPGNTVPGIPENMFVVSADWTQGNFSGGVSAKWVDDRFVDLGNTWVADSYYNTDLYLAVSAGAISSELDNVDLRLTVNNLFDQDWLEGISGNGAWISAPRTVMLTATADF